MWWVGGRLIVVLAEEVGFESRLEGGERGFGAERKRKHVPGERAVDREGAGAKGVEFGAGSAEAEGVGGRAERACRGVQLE